MGRDTFEYIACFDILPEDALCTSALLFITLQDNPEDCHNGKDDDGDGLIDCEDSECIPQRPPRITRKGN